MENIWYDKLVNNRTIIVRHENDDFLFTIPQWYVYSLVEQRGYRDGYTEEQFFIRQLVKLVEELGEVFEFIGIPGTSLPYRVVDDGRQARRLFDSPFVWKDAKLAVASSYKVLSEELADVMVTLLVAATSLARLFNQDFDIVREALDKAQADVERGVRSDNGNRR